MKPARSSGKSIWKDRVTFFFRAHSIEKGTRKDHNCLAPKNAQPKIASLLLCQPTPALARSERRTRNNPCAAAIKRGVNQTYAGGNAESAPDENDAKTLSTVVMVCPCNLTHETI